MDKKTLYNKNSFFYATPTTRWILAACMTIFVLGSFSINAYTDEGWAYAYIITAIFTFAIAKAHSRKMTVAKEGIHFKNYIRRKEYFFPWSEIQSIGISEYYGDKPALNEYLYVSQSKMDEQADIPKYMESENICMIKFQPKAAKCIMMHTRRKIANLEGQRKWRRYAEK